MLKVGVRVSRGYMPFIVRPGGSLSECIVEGSQDKRLNVPEDSVTACTGCRQDRQQTKDKCAAGSRLKFANPNEKADRLEASNVASKGWLCLHKIRDCKG
jgi:hypothetical protein